MIFLLQVDRNDFRPPHVSVFKAASSIVNVLYLYYYNRRIAYEVYRKRVKQCNSNWRDLKHKTMRYIQR